MTKSRAKKILAGCVPLQTCNLFTKEIVLYCLEDYFFYEVTEALKVVAGDAIRGLVKTSWDSHQTSRYRKFLERYPDYPPFNTGLMPDGVVIQTENRAIHHGLNAVLWHEMREHWQR